MAERPNSISDFSAYIAYRTRDFTGREWVFAETDRWLTYPDGARATSGFTPKLKLGVTRRAPRSYGSRGIEEGDELCSSYTSFRPNTAIA
jgi:hypothetical protein